MAANTAELLREAAGLFFVHIVPADVVGRDAWEEDGDQFSLQLGKASADFFAGEFANAAALGDFKTGGLQIGVAGGRSVFAVFNALPQFPKRDHLKVHIVPLVTGPVPFSLYSASSVAELAAQKFASAHVPPLADIRLKDNRFELLPFPLRKSEIHELDWLVMGIGGRQSGSLCKHLASIEEYSDDVRGKTVGDICSRPFNEFGIELGREVSDKFVRVAMSDLAELAKRDSEQIARVVAVAGGRDKVDALAAILRANPRVINFLVTDELTARFVVRKLRTPQPAPPPQPPTYGQIPVDVLRAHQGKWIVWDQDEQRLVGVGDTLEEAEEQADRNSTGHLLRFHHACWTDAVPCDAEPAANA